MRSEADLLKSVPTKLYIGGEWVDAEGGKTLKVSDPATGAHLATIADASEADAKKAIDAAAAAQEEWGNTSPRVRGEILRKAWELLMERREGEAEESKQGRLIEEKIVRNDSGAVR
jgi:succinate-semialdehyde dehydrogenase/glutarate-semialdehyde dehydrogenase